MAYEAERTDHKAVVLAMTYHGMEYCILLKRMARNLSWRRTHVVLKTYFRMRVNKDCMFDITVCMLHIIVSNSDY